MLVTLLGISMLVKLLQLLNADERMLSPPFIITVSNLLFGIYPIAVVGIVAVVILL